MWTEWPKTEEKPWVEGETGPLCECGLSTIIRIIDRPEIKATIAVCKVCKVEVLWPLMTNRVESFVPDQWQFTRRRGLHKVVPETEIAQFIANDLEQHPGNFKNWHPDLKDSAKQKWEMQIGDIIQKHFARRSRRQVGELTSALSLCVAAALENPNQTDAARDAIAAAKLLLASG